MDKKTKNEWSKWSKEAKRDAIVFSILIIMTLGGMVAGMLCQGCSPIKPTHDGKPKFEIKNPVSIAKQKALELFQHQK